MERGRSSWTTPAEQSIRAEWAVKKSRPRITSWGQRSSTLNKTDVWRPATLTRAAHIPSTAGVPPSATCSSRVGAGVRTFFRRVRRSALMMETCAPVSMSAVTGKPSTSTSRRFRSVGRVNRGISGRGAGAASPPGAAPFSFPSESGDGKQGMGNDAAEVNGSGYCAVTVSG